MNHSHLKSMANAIRFLSIDAVQKANSGHPGMPLGMADVATVLFAKYLNHNPDDSKWFNRDRFVLSNGHGSMLLYSILYLTGYISVDELKNFRQMGSKTPGHPEFGLTSGVEATTGPLGQGFAAAVGMALAESILEKQFRINHYTYVMLGDGSLMEGISHEAASLAGHLKLNKLIALFDDNDISIDGATCLSCSDDVEKRFLAYGWNVDKIDGHDFDAISLAIEQAKKSDKPTMICCKTIIGKFSSRAGTSSAHSGAFSEEDIKQMREKLNWNYEPFHVPEDVKNAWKKTVERAKQNYTMSFQRVTLESRKEEKEWIPVSSTGMTRESTGMTEENAGMTGYHAELQRRLDKHLPDNIAGVLADLKKQICELMPNEATRSSFGRVMELLTESMPELIGGSADLTGSNCTKYEHMQVINSNNYSGSYVHYGVREHAMAACMNGMALHGAILPYGGTFLVFSDYCRPAIRLSALMKQQVMYVMTHDSIGVGEDGPTHQPIEHLASLRAIPNLYVFRPADAVETLECVSIALEKKESPALFALSRQNVSYMRKFYSDIDQSANLSKFGAYILCECSKELKVTIFATGSEVEIAVEAREKLQEKGIGTRIVSMPCWRLFDEQSDEYKAAILNNDSIKVAIEAGSEMGWHKYIGSNGIFIGMKSFGESAPYKTLYEHFNISADHVVKCVCEKLVYIQ
ncbi:transketolase [Wolbachia endosymbiont of Drosophila melanogaster]|uniref:transketolase n=2 Tax=Wolbachieae TaxID=952 RepID=UPI000023B9B9|nr:MULTISPECIES: transketolase [Wolbachia]AAS14113.1 transketolase [Wolbachia endosymbiont of Drosophila melanogaster]ERN55831.1 transketolase [Wolbachia pipientis wMelPop]MCE4149938.1 transketolase [Wolbachia endosymbiont of Drosophila melanogaster]MCE4151297.1 transketolase [Wolbachia endosymbiont of Drosophila melanogaster]POG50218.1 transketolase [Wolbachia sp. wMel_AMD]